MKLTHLIILFCILILFKIIFIIISPKESKQMPAKYKKGTCSSHGCSDNSNIDNLLDPAYNMKEIAKQSILLEDHLVHSNKRCPDCIAKHFMFCESLATEAAQLAGSKVNKYPLLDKCDTFYHDLMILN